MIPAAASIVACARDCSTSYTPEPPVEPDRGVELTEDGMLGLGESRHTGIMPGMELVVRAARPDDPAAGLLYVSAAPYYDQYAGGEARRAATAARGLPAPAAHGELGGLPRRGGRTAAVAGVLAAFPAAEGEVLARRFIRLTLGRIPPWRLPGADPPPARVVRGLAAAAGRHALRRRPRHRSRLAAPRRRARAARRGRPDGGGARPARGGARHGDREPRGAGALPAQRLRAARPAAGARRAQRARDRRLGLRRLRQAARPRASASATRSTSSSRSAGKNGSASERAATARRRGTRPRGGRTLAVERHQVDGGQVGLGLHAALAQREHGRVAVAALRAAARRTRTSRGRRRPRPRTAARARPRRRARPAPRGSSAATAARAASMSSSRSSWARPSAQARSVSR